MMKLKVNTDLTRTIDYLIVTYFCIQFILDTISIAGVKLSNIYILLVMIVILLNILIKRKSKLLLTNGEVYYLLFILISVMSVFLSKGSVFEALKLYLKIAMGGLLIVHYNLFGEYLTIVKRVKFIIYFSAVVTLVQVALYYLWGVSKILGIDTILRYYGGSFRPVGTLGGPVTQGILLSVGYFAVFYIFNGKNLLKNRLIVLLSIFFTLTRTAWFVVVFFHLMEYFLRLKQKRNIKKIAMNLLVITAVLFILISFNDKFNFNMITNRFVDFFEAESNQDYGAGRLGLWIATLKGYSSGSQNIHALIGNGYNSSWMYIEKYSIYGLSDATHNDYITIFVENGLVCLLLILLYVHYSFRISCLHSRKYNSSARLYSFVVYILILSVSNIVYSNVMWIMLIIGVAISKSLRDSTRINSQLTEDMEVQYVI